MKILAFDTSTELCSCALSVEGEIVYREQNAGQKHSEILLPMIDSMLAESRLRLTELTAIAYGCGPGSFTGLRITCGVAQGLALGADLPVIGVDSLVALAERADAHKVVACIDARMGEIYHAAYQRHEDEWMCMSDPRVCKPELAPPIFGDEWSGCGSGFERYREALVKRYGQQLSDISPGLLPRAFEIVRIAERRFTRGEAGDAENAVPLYLRDRVALKTSER